MSVWSVLKKVPGILGKVFGVAATVVKVAKPIVYALRDAVPEIGKALGFIEDQLAVAGTEADDFLDRNLPAIVTLEQVSGRGITVMGELNGLAGALRAYSQEQTPDTITEDEARDLIDRLHRVIDQLTQWGPELEQAALLLEAADKDMGS